MHMQERPPETLPRHRDATALGEVKALHGVSSDHLLEPAALRELIEQYQKETSRS